MSEKRFQVFVSSTYEDLKDERASAISGLLEADCFPAGMELFAASDESQWEVIKKSIDESDYYIVIAAGKYGSIDPETDQSYTEREYRYAVESKTPIAGFIHGDLDQLPNTNCEKDPAKSELLNNFHTLVKAGKVVKFWRNKDELRAQITLSILRLSRVRDAIGWVRADSISSLEMAQEVIELRNKNFILQSKLDELKKIETDIDPKYHWYQDEIEFQGQVFTTDHSKRLCEWKVTTSWDYIFIIIGRYFLENSETTIDILCQEISETFILSRDTLFNGDEPAATLAFEHGVTESALTDHEWNPVMYSNYRATIISQCVVHGLAKLDTDGVVQLTPQGRQHWIESNASKI